MPRARRSAAQKLHGDTSNGNENIATAAAAIAQPKNKKRALASTDTVERIPLVPQATTVNPPLKRARKASTFTSFTPYVNNATSATVHFDADSDEGNATEVEAEEGWFGNLQDVQPGPQAASNAINDEHPLWLGQVQNPGSTSSSLSTGDNMTVVNPSLSTGDNMAILNPSLSIGDNMAILNPSLSTGDNMTVLNIDNLQEGNASGAMDTSPMTVTHPTWPTETDIVYVAGSSKVKLSLQGHLLQAIFHDAFDNVRCSLLFEDAFPDGMAIPGVLRKSLVAAAEAQTTHGGHYNSLAARVHQRLLSDEDYESKMIRLPRARIPLFRRDIKERCALIIQVAFLPIQSPATIHHIVDRQLSNYTYTFPATTGTPGVVGLPRRTKPYRNDRIIKVIRDLFFAGGTLAFARRFDFKFPRFRDSEGVLKRELPIPMVALVATALYAAIHEWRTGHHQSTEFSADAFLDVYNGHINTLNHIRVQRSNAFHLMMADLYNLASSTVGDFAGHPIADFDLDGLDD